ncbi:MAG: hydroxymethylglutaryl-CoA reductase [Bacteroidales bacterium]|nr:hydroxymethylglutaryl-CoA reductase [Bacteroidales bacterium]
MKLPPIVKGFSKLSRSEKIQWLADQNKEAEDLARVLNSHLHPDPLLQGMYEEFSENTISNYFLPYGLAPNFLVNGHLYTVPMVIEESSVVAAAASAARFWAMNGGFHVKVVDRLKVGQVHFRWTGDGASLYNLFERNRENLLKSVSFLTERMEKRGGGIRELRLLDKTDRIPSFFQLFVNFHTADAMGANFINSVLEELAKAWKDLVTRETRSAGIKGELTIIMSILSNYTPESLVECYVEAPVKALDRLDDNLNGSAFAEKFALAVNIAQKDAYRAVTHNKGILNGMDAVVIATGNDFRAVEACAHAYASHEGSYTSLSAASVRKGMFRFTLKVPFAVGTVGGLTELHPLAKISLGILGNPGASLLMEIIAAAGLANNFSAVRSLITKGIQQGHMKMHLSNILQRLGATEPEKDEVKRYFGDKTVSHSAVENYLNILRNQSR